MATPPVPNLLPAIAAKTVRTEGRRFFVDEQGVRLPSVTSVLNATKPQADRDALAQWRSRLGAAEATRVATTASRRGTLTHQHIKTYLLGQVRDCPEAAQPYWDSVQPVLQALQDVRLVENFVFHYDLGYAGRVDCLASYQGKPCLCDWKTADRPRGGIERLYDAPLQLAAYCGAVNHCYRDYDIRVRSALVVVALPDAEAEVFWFDGDRMKQYWATWQERLEQFYRRSGVSRGKF
jgi:hypothetical protein